MGATWRTALQACYDPPGSDSGSSRDRVNLSADPAFLLCVTLIASKRTTAQEPRSGPAASCLHDCVYLADEIR